MKWLAYRIGLGVAIVAPWIWAVQIGSCHNLPQGCSWPRPEIPERCTSKHALHDCYYPTEATTYSD